MATSLNADLFRQFPRLRTSKYKINSPRSFFYNCFALVVGKKKQFWWPDDEGFWPPGSRREETVAALVDVLRKHAFIECDDGDFETGYERVAIYARLGIPQHVALQPTNRSGMWVSKLGYEQDIVHELSALEGGDYGGVVRFMKRAKKRKQRGRRRSA